MKPNLNQSDSRLSKTERLLRPADFARVRKFGLSKGGFGLVMGIAPNGLTYGRLGVVVGRRVGGAVVRNRVKRRYREIFRLNKALVAGFDVVMIGRKTEQEPRYEDLTRTFCRLATELKSKALEMATQPPREEGA